MGKDSSQFLTSLYLGSLSILSFSSCNAESITVFGTPINSPIKYNGVLFDLDSCAIFISKKKLCETNRPRVFYCPPTGIIFLFLFFQTGKTGMRESYFLLWLPHHRKDLLNCVDNSLRSHTYLTSYFINSTLYVADSVLKLSSRTVQSRSNLIYGATITLNCLHQKFTTVIVIQLSRQTIGTTITAISKTVTEAASTPTARTKQLSRATNR